MDIGIGRLIEGKQERDAIHIAVMPVVAMEYLKPGAEVGIHPATGKASDEAEHIGIIDPFLKKAVYGGESCWLFLYPGSITSLRHDWTHPLLPAPVMVEAPANYSKHEGWIRDFASRVGLKYEILMEGAADYVASKQRGEWGEFLCFGGLLEGEYVPDEFWPHYEAVTGTSVEEKHRGSFFSCSC